MAGVSTRKYGRVIGEMADTVGVSKSAVSRETVEASERVLKELMERRLDAWDLLVIYLDGIQMGSHHVLAAVGVDSDGKKHVLGVREGASENAEVTSALLEDLVERGLDPGRRRLFVIDGSKALRKAIEKVFGQRHPIQRCRNHKLRNGSSPELCVKVRGSSSMLLLGCLGDLLRFEKREIQVATFAPDRSSP